MIFDKIIFHEKFGVLIVSVCVGVFIFDTAINTYFLDRISVFISLSGGCIRHQICGNRVFVCIFSSLLLVWYDYNRNKIVCTPESIIISQIFNEKWLLLRTHTQGAKASSKKSKTISKTNSNINILLIILGSYMFMW